MRKNMKYEFEKAKDLSGRVYALVQVGRYISIDAMLAQVKQDEVVDLKAYLRRYFLNTHGMPQEAEMKAWAYEQEGAAIGWEYLNALYYNI